LFNQQKRISDHEDFTAPADEEKEETKLSENINITDLMTSSPIMNKKKMMNNIQGLNSEKDKLNTF